MKIGAAGGVETPKPYQPLDLYQLFPLKTGRFWLKNRDTYSGHHPELMHHSNKLN